MVDRSDGSCCFCPLNFAFVDGKNGLSGDGSRGSHWNIYHNKNPLSFSKIIECTLRGQSIVMN